MENLKGNIYGELTVLYDTKIRSKHHIIWHCQCSCGKEEDIKSTLLINHLRDKCSICQGYKNPYMNIQKPRKDFIDIKNQSFGKLTAIEYIKDGKWKCLCECGNICIKDSYDLRVRGVSSCGCDTDSRGEQKIKFLLKENNINFKQEKVFFNFKDTNRPARYDFYIIDKNYIIEYDGIQHFEFTDSGWDTKENFIKTQEHDRIKNQYCFDNNIPIIRIPYWHLKDLCIEDLLLETSSFILTKN